MNYRFGRNSDHWIIAMGTDEILILIILLKGKVLLVKKWEININYISKNEVLLVLQKILGIAKDSKS